MTSLSMKGLEDLLWRHITILLGYDPELEQNQSKVRRSFPKESGPYLELDEDICFFYIKPVDDAINRQMDTYYTEIDQAKARQINVYHRVLELQLTLYGPNSLDNATYLRMDLIEPTKNEELTNNNVCVIPSIQEPNRGWEFWNNHWWPRVDLNVRFNQLVCNDRNEVNYIDSVEIVVETEKDEREVTVREVNK